MTASDLPVRGNGPELGTGTERPPATPVAAPGQGLTPTEAAGLQSWLDNNPQRLLTRRFREAEAALAMADALGVAFQALARLR